jgi:single-stranded-DNA-specific exonuclease
MELIERYVPPRAVWALEQTGLHPLLARLYASRGMISAGDLKTDLAQLLDPSTLKGAYEAALLLATAIENNSRLTVVADYDCDGATSCAVALRGLAMMGASHLNYLVPDRVTDGYGLTPAIADRVFALGTDVLITVDNGIASIEGVARAKELGMKTLITDHHLPIAEMPLADVIVNPNQPGCLFASKNMAGVGVMFYVLLALRKELRRLEKFTANEQPRLDTLLPLVALGTVADVVRLDVQNRRLVAQGLKRVRTGYMQVGMTALFTISGRKSTTASVFDFAFALGPRINAAGRLSDMTFGIELLLTNDEIRAENLAQQLDVINRDRKTIEGGMRETAIALAQDLFDPLTAPPAAITVFDPDFHEGVVGIVATKIKEQFHRPTFVFAKSHVMGELKGSGRSIPGFHLRDALDLIAKRADGVLKRFGGHAMAAGCSIDAARLDVFEFVFASVAAELLDSAALSRRLETDGPLLPEHCRVDLVEMLSKEVWGQGFATPIFNQEFEVLSQRLVGEKHLGLTLKFKDCIVDAIWFGRITPLPVRAHLAYRIDINEWKKVRRIQFLIEALSDKLTLS